MSRAAARNAVRSQYFFVANEEEAFSVFGRSEVQDINRIRQITDVPCLLAFIFMLICMFVLDLDAVRYGNVLRLSEPIDFKGNLCGYDEEVEDRPLGYHPNPYNDMVVCVSSCPKAAADGDFSLPDGPMGKMHTRQAYPTSQSFGQFCLPLDLSLARLIISVKSVQTEMYKALGMVFSFPGVMLIILSVPMVTSFIYIIMLFYVPSLASTLAFSTTAVTLALVGKLMELDQEALVQIPLYVETHPLLISLQPLFQALCYLGSVCFLGFLLLSLPTMARAHLVFHECMAAIINRNVLITVFTSLAISVLRIVFILRVCRQSALLMSIVNPVEVKLQLFGEWHVVKRNSWSPYFMRGVFFYAFGTFWILEFLSFSNKYITAQILCHNYFSLKARNAAGQDIGRNKFSDSPLWYALYSLFRYHLGSVAFAALAAFPCRALRFAIGFFVPDRPNLQNSLNQQYRIAYWLFWPLIQLDLHFLRFFKDSVWVMLPLKGYKYMHAARRVEGLLNRSRGKIPNLTKFTGRIDIFLNLSVGLSTFFWTFFLNREPRHGRYHEVEQLDEKESLKGLFSTPEHSPLLALPIIFCFGVWVGNGMLHLVTMSSETLTVCYCIDVEMVGGTETDALYVPNSLRDIYKDLGGGESERELSEMIAFSNTGL
mmetsp:Transcript_19845/g.42272  ORF Transcript_19845/g.42272 Transcript_19845/m.42272 type:complete len:655 (-) Transcript_19845:38-2002(-)